MRPKMLTSLNSLFKWMLIDHSKREGKIINRSILKRLKSKNRKAIRCTQGSANSEITAMISKKIDADSFMNNKNRKTHMRKEKMKPLLLEFFQIRELKIIKAIYIINKIIEVPKKIQVLQAREMSVMFKVISNVKNKKRLKFQRAYLAKQKNNKLQTKD